MIIDLNENFAQQVTVDQKICKQTMYLILEETYAFGIC